jgi:phenolic acid decarboxylase
MRDDENERRNCFMTSVYICTYDNGNNGRVDRKSGFDIDRGLLASEMAVRWCLELRCEIVYFGLPKYRKSPPSPPQKNFA